MLNESQKKRLKELANIKISEEKIGNNFYFYHATITKSDLSYLHSFRNGISIKKSVGFGAGQGSGFYLFQNKKSAIDRAFSDTAVGDGVYREFNKQTDGNRLLVTLESDNMDVTKFVVDNELSSKLVSDILFKYVEKLKNLDLGESSGYRIQKYGVQPTKFGTLSITAPVSGKTVVSSMKPGSEDISSSQANTLAAFFDLLREKQPKIYNNIQQEMFSDTDAIKYIGADLIKPYKLEIINEDGTLIDVTTKDPI